jgi:hypothetical protein
MMLSNGVCRQSRPNAKCHSMGWDYMVVPLKSSRGRAINFFMILTRPSKVPLQRRHRHSVKRQTVSIICVHVYNMTQRQPAVGSSSPSLLFAPLPPLASSSSTTSCGFTVMCTTFGFSLWKRQSVIVSIDNQQNRLGSKDYLSVAKYRPTCAQSVSTVSSSVM